MKLRNARWVQGRYNSDSFCVDGVRFGGVSWGLTRHPEGKNWDARCAVNEAVDSESFADKAEAKAWVEQAVLARLVRLLEAES